MMSLIKTLLGINNELNELLKEGNWNTMDTAPSNTDIYLKCNLTTGEYIGEYVCVGKVDSEKKIRVSSNVDPYVFFRSGLIGWKPCEPKKPTLQDITERAKKSYNKLYNFCNVKPNAWVISEDLLEILLESISKNSTLVRTTSTNSLEIDSFMGLKVHKVYGETNLIKATIES